MKVYTQCIYYVQYILSYILILSNYIFLSIIYYCFYNNNNNNRQTIKTKHIILVMGADIVVIPKQVGSNLFLSSKTLLNCFLKEPNHLH